MSCTPETGFPNAASMQQLATNLPVVWEEICKIQQAILAASSQCQVGGGQMCTTVAGDTPMTFVSGVDTITVTNAGSGYYQDTPAMVFVAPIGSSGDNATGTVTTNGGNILSINVVTPGSGYQPMPATTSISSVIGAGAIIDPLVNASGEIVSVNIVDPGLNYTTADTITAIRAVAPYVAYVDAEFQISAVSITGEILSVIIVNPGSGYQASVATVEIISSLNPLLPYPLGTGFMADVITDVLGQITQVVVTNTGAGYAVYPPYLVITDPGSGATTSITLSGITVGSVSVLTPGSNYTQSATGTILNPITAAAPNPPASQAVVDINVSTNTYGTTPLTYWQVWSGAATNKPIQLQMNTVLSYFKGLGYTISIQSNPATSNTIQWRICW